MIVPCHFAKGALDFVLPSTSRCRSIGLRLLPHPTSVPWTPPPYAAKDARTRELTVGDLGGTLTVPAGAGPFPCIVLVHGSGPNDRDETIGPNKVFADLAAGLAANGVATLRYDKRTRVKPETLPKDFTVEDEVIKDAVVAASVIGAARDRSQARVRARPQPRRAGSRRGSRRSKGLAGILLWPGRPALADKIVEQITYIANLDGSI